MRADVLVVSVPVSETAGVVEKVAPFLGEESLIMDLASVKKRSMEAMMTHSRGEVLGLHPLFGPHEAVFEDLTLAVCPGRGEQGLNWITSLFSGRGLRIIVLSPEEHDFIMGLVQGVNHFSTLALSLCILESGIDIRGLEKSSTVTFQERLERIRRLLGQPADLFQALLMENPEAGRFIEHYRESVFRLSRLVEETDEEEFRRLFGSLRRFFLK